MKTSIIRAKHQRSKDWYYVSLGGALLRDPQVAERMTGSEAAQRINQLRRDYPAWEFEIADHQQEGPLPC